MIYYKRLWQRKKGALLIMLFLDVMLFSFLYAVLNSNTWEGSTMVYISNYEVFVGQLFTVPILCFLLYGGLVFLPMSSYYAQDLSEFDVTSDKVYLHIRFRKYSWQLKRQDFGPQKFMFFDKEHHFVGMTRAYQVYNAVCRRKEVISSVGGGALKDKIAEIPGAHCLTREEKEHLFVRAGLNKKHIGVKIWGAFMIVCGISFFSMPDSILDPVPWKIVVSWVLAILLGGGFIWTGIFLLTMNKDEKKARRVMMGTDVFKVRVYCYDKLYLTGRTHRGVLVTHYYIKISDGKELFFDERYEVTQKQYQNSEQRVWEAYYYQTEAGAMKIMVLEQE